LKHLPFYLILLIASSYSCKKPKDANSYIYYHKYLKADSLAKINDDSAFYYLNEVATEAKDRYTKGAAYNQMAAIQLESGDYFGKRISITYLLRSKRQCTP
jgi:hypothetical protein